MKSLMIFFSVLLFVACDDNNSAGVDDTDKLIGYWAKAELVDTVWQYKRTSSLEENAYGFSFDKQKLFIERKNSGWCGTPPISYSDFEGTWNREDSIVDISVKYWGGIAKYQWKIISVDANTLKIYKVKEEFETTE